MKTSLGEVNEDLVNKTRPLERTWTSETVPVWVRVTGVVKGLESTGWLVDEDGVRGIGSTKTLTLAISPALK